MILDDQLKSLFKREFAALQPNSILKNKDGEYEVFGRYIIVKEQQGYTVYCSLTKIGLFHSSRAALSWCIADKFEQYNKARDILNLDNNLHFLTVDITTRALVGDRAKTAEQHEIILTKLENKIIQKKQIENRLADCVNWAKYYQQRGFNNETARLGHTATNKTNR